ncbi:MAG: two-component system response regulator CreB [Deltaproteobacteria bacterium]|nr:two-component system response regulator CreB [Deltaproteobacteria bacterium]
MPSTVLLVEDESAIADNVLYALRTAGFVAVWRSLGQEALALLRSEPVDLVVLDIGLPDANGIEVCKSIRAFSQVPIIFLTARADEIDKVVGLEIGADDYVTKPFSPRELAARVKVILKRTQASAPTTPAAAGKFVVDAPRARISYVGVPLELTRYEYLLLQFLVAHPEQVFSRAQLLDRVWDASQTSLDRTVDAHVKSLRAKLRAITPNEDPIATHRGLGYSLTGA